MAMTKKDYVLIANAFAAQREEIKKNGSLALKTLDATIETMAAHFAIVNESFKQDIFIKVAKGEGGSGGQDINNRF